MLPPGSRVGRYVVREPLGAGGMGEVYAAHDPTLNRLVALKVVRADVQLDKLQERFRQEAWAASALNHPNILTIYELGETDGVRFIASELVEGQTLRQILKARPGRLPLLDVLHITQQIASALSTAHAAGIVHRDIKPENVMVRADGYVKVLDFGLAKRTPTSQMDADVPTALTAPGVLLGTVLYMAPEQVRGLPVDARADVWAFGCVLYEMVTGQSPFLGKTTADILAAVLEREPAPPASLRTDAPPALTAIITRALAKDPAQRFQAMPEVADALRAVARSLDVPAPSGDDVEIATVDVNAPPTLTPVAAIPLIPDASGSPARSRRAMLVGLGAVGAGLVLAAWVLRDTNAGAPPAPPNARPPAQTLSVWLTVQRFRDGKPYETEFISSGQDIFESGWKFRLNASSPDRTYLYVVNEGKGDGDATTLHLLFPAPGINDGSAQLSPGGAMQTGWYVFTKNPGTESFWLVAAREPVPQLEAVKGVVNPRDQGLVSDVAQLAAIRELLAKASQRPPSVEKDQKLKHTVLRSSEPVLAHLMWLEHH